MLAADSLMRMAGMGDIRFDAHTAIADWNLSPFPLVVTAILIGIGYWYLRAEWTLARKGRRWSPWRTLFFFSGLAAIELALASSVAVLANVYFQAHIVQHLLLMATAPPLLALGAPSTLLLQTSSRTVKSRWLHVLRSKPFAALTHPVTAWGLYYVAMFAFFLTGLVNFAMWHMWVMDICNVVFLLGGTVYWWPMLGIDPIIHWKMSHGARLFNVLLGGGVEAFLGVAILNDSHPAASMYTLSSTHAGGALLWVSTELVALFAFVPIFVQWMRSEDRIAARHDAHEDRIEAEAARVLAPGGDEHPGPIAPHTLTVWEEQWLARTGTVPFQTPRGEATSEI